jgi:predicted phage terminase large subunit-like protein
MADGYPIHKFPALMPDSMCEGQIENCADYILELDLQPGESTQPERFPLDLLMERKAKVGPKLFSLHYHLDTTLADAERYPLKLADLVVLDLDYEVAPEKVVWASKQINKSMPSFGLSGDVVYEPMWISQNYQPYVQKVMHIDPSGRGSDETAVCVSGYLNGYVFVTELLGYEGGYDEGTLKKIVQVAIETDVKLIRFESNFGDAMFGQILLPVMKRMGCQAGIEEYRVTGNKNKRIIDTLEPVMASHRLIIDRKAIRQEQTQRQITRITEIRGSLKHDDRVDALAASVSYWEEAMGVNVDSMIEASEIARQEAVVDDWMSDERRIMAIAYDRTIGNVEVNGKEFRMQTPKPFRNRLLRKFKR